MPKEAHIINKVLIEVNANTSKAAFKLKDQLDVFFQHQVIPEMERYFDIQSARFPKANVQFDRMELALHVVDFENLNDIKNQLIHQLKKKFDAAFEKEKINLDEKEFLIVPKNKSQLDVFLYFLKTGLKPWWKPDLIDFLDEKNIRMIISEKGFYSELIKTLSYKNARERLINQFSNDFLVRVLKLSDSIKFSNQQNVFLLLEKHKTLKQKFWMAIIEYYKSKKIDNFKTALYDLSINDASIGENDNKMLKTFAEELIGKSLKHVKKLQKKIKEEETPKVLVDKIFYKDEHEAEGIFVNNAGLVLMHPFLKTFFVNAELADLSGKMIASKVETAIHLLHYLSTKKEQPYESELVLEKFLCGVSIEQPVERFIKLSKELKGMAEDVLQAAITHWTALKNTTPDGLRTAFLQREGKLIVKNGACRLLVERKTQDILLDKIPWNVHLIKLPWRNDMVFLEW